ncbi:uncharacterized protein [Nicotiana sylvestris]|uniref:uncharacterized protein n=1 Tax=Nicotiana sylvestris TaxID=4096 RepID=UPI00388C83C0
MAGKELDASVIDPPREEEESEPGLKEELHKLKHQMAEMYSEPVFQAQDNQYYAPEPTFKVPDHYSYTPHFELPVKTEKPPKNTEHEEMFRKVKSLEQSLRNMQGLGGQVSVAYKDLCLFPDVQLPVGFKMPKFDFYNGHRDPVAHLSRFCSKMRGAGGKDELLMANFSQSLSGAALEWYTRQDNNKWYTWDDLAQAFARHFQFNVEIVPDRLSLTKIEKTPSESFMEPEYRKERQQRKQIFTPLGESYTSLFQRLTQVGILTPIESLPNPPSKNLDYSVKCVYCSNAPRHDTEKCWHLKSAIQELIDTNQIEVQSPEAPNINQNPLPAHAETHMIEIVYKDGKAEKPSKSIIMIRASESNSVKTPVATNTTSSAIEGLTDKLSQLDVKPPMLVAKWSLDDVETNQGKLKVVMPGVARKEVEEEVNETLGLTHLGRCFAPEELRKAKTLKDSPTLVKKPITEEEAEEFLRKIKVQDYTIVEQLRKIPAQISFLSLLIHLDEHRRALMKILNEAHVPDKITVNNLEKIANKIFEANRITFSDDEPPLEGMEHNRAIYLTVKCEDSVVTRVLVDNGSSANICPLSTLHKLKIDTERIHKNNICVRGFDKGGKDFVGDIVLELTIGPVEFTMEFQVLDMAVSYNLLLGRPWIHIAKAVPSSLHQMVKFEWDRQEIIVHGNENLCAYNDTFVPFIEAKDDKGPWVY